MMIARLLELEIDSSPGPVRCRFRARRASAVRVYRREHAALSEVVPWSAPDAARGRRLAPPRGRRSTPAQVHGWALFAIDAL